MLNAIYRSNNIEFYISYSDLKLQNMLSVAQIWKQYSWSNNTFVERLLVFFFIFKITNEHIICMIMQSDFILDSKYIMYSCRNDTAFIFPSCLLIHI